MPAPGPAGPRAPALVLRRLSKSFDGADGAVPVLTGIDLTVDGGSSVAVTGPSGSGKSTLLHLIGTLDEPTGGGLEVDGVDPFALGERDLARFRNDVVGFVFQDHHLLPQLDVLENVLIPTLAFGTPDEGDEERAGELIGRVGLGHRIGHRPGQLSGGERQRVAVARALIRRPRLLLCDEPTGSLDRTNAESVADLLFELHREEGALLLLATHHEGLARRCDRVLELGDGRCSEV